MNIDVVIIGLNSARTLKQCIESVLNSHQPHPIKIFYVDGGSKDHSIEIAMQFPQVDVLQLKTEYPTPGAGRNLGWKAGKAPLIQFLDSDTLIHTSWFEKALPHFQQANLGAVRGLRKELFPENSIFNWIGDHEWNAKPGLCDMFGGDVLVKREVLEKTEGYNEQLVGGEDPELSLRVRQLGWDILQLDTIMTYHDLNMTTLGQYWKRAYRSGYGFAAVTSMHSKSNFWKKESQRILIRGSLTIAFFLLALFFHWIFLVPGLLFLFYPRLFKIAALEKELNLDLEEARIYAWHASFVVVPQFFGMLRYYLGKLFNYPLRNKA